MFIETCNRETINFSRECFSIKPIRKASENGGKDTGEVYITTSDNFSVIAAEVDTYQEACRACHAFNTALANRDNFFSFFNFLKSTGRGLPSCE